MWETQPFKQCNFFTNKLQERKKSLFVKIGSQLQCMDFDFIDLIRPSKKKTKTKKLWDDQGDLNSDQIFDDIKKLMLILMCGRLNNDPLPTKMSMS